MYLSPSQLPPDLEHGPRSWKPRHVQILNILEAVSQIAKEGMV